MFEVIGIIVIIWLGIVLVMGIKPIMKAVKAKIEFDAFMAERMAAEAAEAARERAHHAR